MRFSAQLFSHWHKFHISNNNKLKQLWVSKHRNNKSSSQWECRNRWTRIQSNEECIVVHFTRKFRKHAPPTMSAEWIVQNDGNALVQFPRTVNRTPKWKSTPEPILFHHKSSIIRSKYFVDGVVRCKYADNSRNYVKAKLKHSSLMNVHALVTFDSYSEPSID